MIERNLAERVARAYYARYSQVAAEQWPWERYPGRELMILDARRYLQSINDAGLAVVEADDGR